MDYQVNTTYFEDSTSGIGDVDMDALARVPVKEVANSTSYFNSLIEKLDADKLEFINFTTNLYAIVGDLFEISQPKNVESNQIVENKFDHLYEAYMFRLQFIWNLYHLCDQLSFKISGEKFDYEHRKIESKDDIICLVQYDEIFQFQFGVIYDLLRYINSSVNPLFTGELFEIDPIDFKGPNYMFHIILEGDDFLLNQCQKTIHHFKQIF